MNDEFWVVIFFGVICVACCLGTIGFFFSVLISLNPGTGQQIGYIAEVENSGIFWRPDEIVLIGSEATFSNSQAAWEYASASPEITRMARYYLKTHEKVVVEYETVLVAYGWEYSHPTRITSIRLAGAEL